MSAWELREERRRTGAVVPHLQLPVMEAHRRRLPGVVAFLGVLVLSSLVFLCTRKSDGVPDLPDHGAGFDHDADHRSRRAPSTPVTGERVGFAAPMDTAAELIIEVVDAGTAQPIGGARVWVKSTRRRYLLAEEALGSTDDRGRLVVSAPAEAAHVAVAAQGYRAWSGSVEAGSRACRAELGRGVSLFAGVKDLLGRPLSGVVLHASRRLVEGAEVPDLEEIVPFGAEQAALHAATSRDGGLAEFPAMVPGCFDVRPASWSGYLATVHDQDRGPYCTGAAIGGLRVALLVGCAVRVEGQAIHRVEVMRSQAGTSPFEEQHAVATLERLLRPELGAQDRLFLWPVNRSGLADLERGELHAVLYWFDRATGWTSKPIRVWRWDEVPSHVEELDPAAASGSALGTIEASVEGPDGAPLEGLRLSLQKLSPTGPHEWARLPLASGAQPVPVGEYSIHGRELLEGIELEPRSVRILPDEVTRVVVRVRSPFRLVRFEIQDRDGAELSPVKLVLVDDQGASLCVIPWFRSGGSIGLPVPLRCRARFSRWPSTPVEEPLVVEPGTGEQICRVVLD
ncbi:MAG: hypothetical protein IT457_14175 [Planctomycetes bacterium]|nr:hypothetical protein [Planctomycetota bacterium]